MASLLGIYFAILAAVSGWEFTLSQFWISGTSSFL